MASWVTHRTNPFQEPRHDGHMYFAADTDLFSACSDTLQHRMLQSQIWLVDWRCARYTVVNLDVLFQALILVRPPRCMTVVAFLCLGDIIQSRTRRAFKNNIVLEPVPQ